MAAFKAVVAASVDEPISETVAEMAALVPVDTKFLKSVSTSAVLPVVAAVAVSLMPEA
ncbi:MAG: hypothetical protein JJ952_09845 [Pseudomonadales bacterium]|nr:hypothetical protein [Pseudomonadales bacterium]